MTMKICHKRFVASILLCLIGRSWCSRLGLANQRQLRVVGEPPAATCIRPPPLQPPILSDLSPKTLGRYDAVRKAIQHAWNGYVLAIHEEEQVRNQYHPPDDLNPLSHRGESWLYFAATLHDSIDTLYLAQLHSEYQQARGWILGMDLQTTSSNFIKPTKTFEYSLRVVGGMLGAYSVSGDTIFLHAAKRATDALLEGPFAASWTPLPRMYQVLAPPLHLGDVFHLSRIPSLLLGVLPRRIYAALYTWGRDMFTEEHIDNSLAGVGSFGLEFEFLSSMTNVKAYQQAHSDIFDVLEKAYQDYGGLPIIWNVKTGEPYGASRRHSTSNARNANQKRGFTVSNAIGSGADSFYEYLVKIPIFKGCATMNEGERSDGLNEQSNSRCALRDEAMLLLYNDFVGQELTPNHVHRPSQQEIIIDQSDEAAEKNKDIAYPTDHNIFHHLLCFVPGMLALGVHRGVSDRPIDDLALAQELVRGCYDTYHRSPTGLGPETVRFHRQVDSFRKPNLQSNNEQRTMGDSEYEAVDRRYLLRPELVESLFVLYRVTKNPLYQEWAWEIFESIEKHCKRDWGYAGVDDVYHRRQPESGVTPKEDANGSTIPLVDDMPSYFIAETLKYLLLIFGPDEYVSLDEFVFTTEAHPLWIPKDNSGADEEGKKSHGSIPCDHQASRSDTQFHPPVQIPWLVLSLLLSAIGAVILVGFGCVFIVHSLQMARRRAIRLLERKSK